MYLVSNRDYDRDQKSPWPQTYDQDVYTEYIHYIY